MRWRVGFVLWGGLLLAAAPALAQVNTEKLRSWETPGPSGSLDFALTVRSGNVSELLVGSSVRAQWAELKADTATSSQAKLQELVYFIGDISLGIRTKERFKNAGFAHVRWTHMWSGSLGSELFVQAQYNEFIRLQQRYLGGLGARWEFIEGRNFEVIVGSGYMLEFEQYDVPEDGPDGRRVLAHRWTNYLSLKGYLKDPKVTLVETVYAQPRLSDFGDYRILSEAELAITITDRLEVVAGLYLRYDSQPVVDVDPLDLTFLNRLRVGF